MESTEALAWVLAITGALLLVAWLASALRRWMVRRERRERYRREERASRPARLDPSQLHGRISTGEAEAIRRHAEQCARETLRRHGREQRNPHPKGTREYVLWATTYHLTLAELAEEESRRSGIGH